MFFAAFLTEQAAVVRATFGRCVLLFILLFDGIAVAQVPAGSIVQWGDQFNSDNTGPFKQIAAGESHNLGLRPDGSVVAWGEGIYGQTNVPEPNNGFLAVAAGSLHSVGLKDDGSIVTWGCYLFFVTPILVVNVNDLLLGPTMASLR